MLFRFSVNQRVKLGREHLAFFRLDPGFALPPSSVAPTNKSTEPRRGDDIHDAVVA
jgi:hypothetical protein